MQQHRKFLTLLWAATYKKGRFTLTPVSLMVSTGQCLLYRNMDRISEQPQEVVDGAHFFRFLNLPPRFLYDIRAIIKLHIRK